jgi:Spy/CpxP family protein refolding chaperone
MLRRSNAVKFLAAPLLALALQLSPAFYARAHAQSQAEPQATPPGPASGRLRRRLFRQLDLTPEQLRQMTAIRRAAQSEQRQLNRRRAQARLALEKEIAAESPDRALVERRVSELAEAQRAAETLSALTEVEMRRVLTPQQRAVLRSLLERYGARRRGARQRR